LRKFCNLWINFANEFEYSTTNFPDRSNAKKKKKLTIEIFQNTLSTPSFSQIGLIVLGIGNFCPSPPDKIGLKQKFKTEK